MQCGHAFEKVDLKSACFSYTSIYDSQLKYNFKDIAKTFLQLLFLVSRCCLIAEKCVIHRQQIRQALDIHMTATGCIAVTSCAPRCSRITRLPSIASHSGNISSCTVVVWPGSVLYTGNVAVGSFSYVGEVVCSGFVVLLDWTCMQKKC